MPAQKIVKTYAWTGAVNASTSTETTVSTAAVRTNLETDPSLEVGISNWGGSTNWSLSWSTEQASLGTHSLKATRTTNNTGNGFTQRSYSGLTVGTNYTWSIDIWSSTDTNFSIFLGGATFPDGNAVHDILAFGANKWVRLSFTVAATSSTVNFLISDDANANVAAGTYIYIDRVLMEAASAPAAYFDGSTPTVANMIDSRSLAYMYGDKMYFGNKERMTWVAAPDASYDATSLGWDGNTTQFVNGGAFVQRSVTAHKHYTHVWTMKSRDEIRAVADYIEGLYGDGAVYFLDPMAMDQNLLPQHWATPRLALKDAPLLNGMPRNSIIEYPTPLTNNLGYPIKAPFYSYDSATWPAYNTLVPKLWVPIPPGYTAWFGAHGVVAQNGLFRITRSDGSTVIPAVLDVTDTTRFNVSFNGNQYSSITLAMDITSGGVFVPSGMMLQILPNGLSPVQGGFISGQGHGGGRFTAQAQTTSVNAALDKQTLTTDFVEDELWR